MGATIYGQTLKYNTPEISNIAVYKNATGRANLGAAKVHWSASEPSDWTANDMWLQIID